jgi:D-alanine--poly(phosphoribitol) ligase subunit 1
MNNGTTFYSQVIEPFLQSLHLYSEKNAFCINEEFFTYKQLGEYISKTRSSLTKMSPDEIYIGLVANDDIETYASIFAIWLEGKAYIPLHPNQPMDRCKDIISQMGINSIIDSSEITRYAKYHVIETKKLDYHSDLLNYDNTIDNDNAAYILFTSGSTGKPKGVILTRRNLGAFMNSFWDSGIILNENDRCLQCFDLTFDVSVQSFLTPLVKGACVYTIPHDQIKYSYVYGLLIDHKLTFGAMAPSMLRYLKPYFEEINAPDLKFCILTAEASPLALVEEWQHCIPNAKIYNFYGPTEATIYCTYHKTENNKENKSLNGMLSIGKGLKNVTTILIDENNNILSNGEKGELCVSGEQVSPGYWNNDEKNKSSFFEKEWKGMIHRFYRTGDVCCFDNDNDLLLYGRLDYQAKIQGYRIELGEIEYHAREFLHGQNAVAIAFENKTGNTEIALFVEGQLSDTKFLLTYLKSKMPYYMVPTKIIFESKFPLNSNGKIDRNMLKKIIVL